MTEASRIRESTIVQVRDLPLLADIGINPDEVGRRQPLVITMVLGIASQGIEAIDQTVDYRRLVAEAEDLAKVHIPLIETFGRMLAERCMALPHVEHVRVKIDKPFAITRGLAGIEVSMGAAHSRGGEQHGL